MQTEKELAIQKLGELVQVSKDAELGFRKAASEIRDKREQALFRMTAQERAEFAIQLQKEMRRIGACPPYKGTTLGILHRIWIEVRYQLSLRNEGSVKQECLRGEEKALSAYQDLFWDHTLYGIEPMLEAQYVRIIEMRDRLRGETHPEDQKKDKNILLL